MMTSMITRMVRCMKVNNRSTVFMKKMTILFNSSSYAKIVFRRFGGVVSRVLGTLFLGASWAPLGGLLGASWAPLEGLLVGLLEVDLTLNISTERLNFSDVPSWSRLGDALVFF